MTFVTTEGLVDAYGRVGLHSRGAMPSRSRVEITHPDKILFPEDGITKAELVAYYRNTARAMLPYLRDRPANLQRFPGGIGKSGFFQQDISEQVPDWVDTVTVPKEGGTVRHVVLQSADILAYVANQGCITPHVWLSRRGALDYPDQMIFDVDPPEDAELDAAREITSVLGGILKELGAPAFVKTTGSRGYHVVVPLAVGEVFEGARELAGQIVAILATRMPDRVTTETRKAKRAGRVYLDTLRNAYAHTAVPPFAVRARAGAPVAAPISWDELSESAMRPDRFTLRTLHRRLEEHPNPWRNFRRRTADLAAVRTRLEELRQEAAPAKVKAIR